MLKISSSRFFYFYFLRSLCFFWCDYYYLSAKSCFQGSYSIKLLFRKPQLEEIFPECRIMESVLLCICCSCIMLMTDSFDYLLSRQLFFRNKIGQVFQKNKTQDAQSKTSAKYSPSCLVDSFRVQLMLWGVAFFQEQKTV